MGTYSVNHSSVSFRKYFHWAVESIEEQDTQVWGKLQMKSNIVPDYKKAVDVFLQFHPTREVDIDYFFINLIDSSYRFIWEGLEIEKLFKLYEKSPKLCEF